MGFSSGGYNFELAALSKKATRGKTTSDTFVYVGTNGGSVDPAGAADAVLSYYRATQRDLIPFCKLMANTSTRSMLLSPLRSTRRSLIQSRLTPPAHRRISINRSSRVESMLLLAKSLPTIAVR
jgi:hypothetical protein